MEYGASCFLDCATGMPASSAYAMSFVRLFKSHSRHGAIAFTSGFSP